MTLSTEHISGNMRLLVRLLWRSSATVLLISTMLMAQEGTVTYTAVPGESELSVDGASNHGQFNVYADEFTVEMGASGEATAENPGLVSVNVTIPAKQVVSRRSVIMDRLTHNAFKADEHPNILYELTSAEPGDDNVIKTTGNLTLAGVTNPIEMDVTYEVLDDGRLHFVGSYGFNMTQFEIEPPTALFGRFRVTDPVEVHFDLIMAKQ